MHVALLAALVLRPLPPDVVARIGALAQTLGVDDGMVEVAQLFAAGSLGFLRQDWFALAPMRIDEVRARFGLRPEAPEAIAAGSAGPGQLAASARFS